MPHNLVLKSLKKAWMFFALSFWQGERQAYQRHVYLFACLLVNKQEPLLCVYLQCDGIRSNCWLCWSAILEPSEQTKPLLSPLSALTSAQRWDDWGLCFSESIIITQSIKMSCLLICIKIYCASDISRLRKIYISQHTSSILFPLFQKKGYWNKRFDYIFGTTRRCLQQKSTQEGG